jgi:hypothetical protein
MLAAATRWTFLISLVLLSVSCWRADELPNGIEVLPELAHEPEQVRIDQAPFEVEQGGVAYQVAPQYRYRLHGLVVSRRAHDGNRMLHGRWQDHLNVADVCVVWGQSASGDLAAFEFWSGQFTCFFRTPDELAWRSFRPDQISNNHLLSADVDLRRQLAGLRVGDQIRVEGWLASYRNATGFERGTSVTRTDTGNGACETIYVTGFEMLSRSPSLWPGLQSMSIFSLLGSMLLWMVGVLRGWI